MKALVDHQLRDLCEAGYVSHQYDSISLTDHIQPASMDLAIGADIYHVKQKFVPFERSVRYVTDRLTIQQLDAREPVVLYKGQTYLIPCLHLNLAAGMSAKVSPKSSIGRIDVLVRTVTDATGLYDVVTSGYTGDLWMEVTPQSFNIRVQQGVTLSQMMVFEEGEELEMSEVMQEDFLFVDGERREPEWYEQQLLVSIGLNHEIVGYVARETNEILDLTQIGVYEPHRFFDPLSLSTHSDHRKLILEKDQFYILTTREAIRVPVGYSLELVPSTHLMGELRVHYAGFFDPGWGANSGAIGVLEVRSHENMVVYDGQPLCFARVYENKALPDSPYGSAGNNYHLQTGPRLAKYFTQNDLQ